MRSSLLAAILVCLSAFRAAAAEPARRIALMVAETDSTERDLFLRLVQVYRTRERVFSDELTDAQRTDPIAKDKLLSTLRTCDLVVAVGNGATDFALTELKGVRVFFVDAMVVPGSSLGAASVSGLFAYSVEDLLDAVTTLRLGALGIAFTPGYEPVVEWIRAGAAARGLSSSSKKIRSPKELAPAVRSLLERSRVIWLVGDPLLVRGAGFEFLQESTLSEDVPVVSPGEWTVAHGALLGYAPNRPEQEAAAVRMIDLILRGRRDSGPRLITASRGGVILINAALAAKWNLRAPEGPRWRRVK